jgi:hypothetical protein
VSPQLFDHAEAEDGFFAGMMQNVKPD